MRPPAMLEHEPPMLLGFSWSEVTSVFFPTTAIWLLLGLTASVVGSSDIQQMIMLGMVVYLIGESATMVSLAYWYAKVKKTKYDGWHLHMIATKFNWLGVFHNLCYTGKWRC